MFTNLPYFIESRWCSQAQFLLAKRIKKAASPITTVFLYADKSYKLVSESRRKAQAVSCQPQWLLDTRLYGPQKITETIGGHRHRS
jgi:hypothetical protein